MLLYLLYLRLGSPPRSNQGWGEARSSRVTVTDYIHYYFLLSKKNSGRHVYSKAISLHNQSTYRDNLYTRRLTSAKSSLNLKSAINIHHILLNILFLSLCHFLMGICRQDNLERHRVTNSPLVLVLRDERSCLECAVQSLQVRSSYGP